jgi:FkbM family methyltransferase
MEGEKHVGEREASREIRRASGYTARTSPGLETRGARKESRGVLVPSPEGLPVIVDIGLHRGDDAEFYLKKGFRVVGVEANPAHIEHCRARFASQIQQGQIQLVHAAISDVNGEATFYVNLDKDDWSSTDPRYGARAGSRHETITVPAITIENLLTAHVGGADVYYLKSDIEGGDIHVLSGLLRTPSRPRYLSVEAHDPGYLAYLYVLGYRRFKLVNQNLNWRIQQQDPPKEGRLVEHTFGEHSSGPFGEETTGAWMPYERVVELDAILRRTWALEPTLSNAWYDIHATGA